MIKTYQETQRKIAEFHKLNYRLTRYWKALKKQAFKQADEQGLVIVLERNKYSKSNEIPLFRNNEVYENEFFLLAKPQLPSLYRRYYQGLEKHFQILADLKSRLEEITTNSKYY